MNTTLSLNSTSTVSELGQAARPARPARLPRLTRLTRLIRARVAAVGSTLRQPRSREELAERFALRREAERLRDEMRRTVHVARGY